MTEPRQSLMGMELADIEAALGDRYPRYRAKQLYEALYSKRLLDLSRASALPAALRTEFPSGALKVDSRYDSIDGTVRYLMALEDGKTVESVFMPERGRDTLCISSQVGCPVDCKFCLTALMGLERNLTAGEIVGQVLHIAAEHNLEPKDRQMNIVMMGQGEPMMNLDAVLKATRLLVDPAGVGMSERRITVSTSGLIPKIEEMGKAAIRPKLAISLNASTEEQRVELMPITKKWHLKDLIEVCLHYPLRSWEFLTFEYVLLRGVNDTDGDARRVRKLLANLKCKVNLIALNPGPGIPFETPDPERVESFQEIVKLGMPCFIRRPRGLDIYAACGQLKRMTEGADLVDISY
ncbi:MAG: 23S rRNA (adenine(2503)-C(2))-methyltransferase RlmN [Acidobacteria bacterium]|nr:23S rRNA (adenine(2503)-C(2))-methyltransferase RlmN [Acidobacteriota bacterium]